jgi:predicted transposase/invertase (TIGR01784 family)
MFDSEQIIQSHDGYFKAIFSSPETAAMFFRAQLPAALVQAIDWTTLAVVPGSFVKGDLQQGHTDLVFSAKLGDRDVRLYLLFEHQSTVDPTMPLRLLVYMTELLVAYEKEHGLPLPPVIPFVLHQGPDRWTVSTAFEDLFDLPGPMRDLMQSFIPKFQHGLLDLTQFDPLKESNHDAIRTILQLMKLARAKRLLEFFEWLTADYAGELSPHQLRRSLVYAFNQDITLDLEVIANKLESNTELSETTMTIIEQCIAKGHARGVEQGIEQGMEQGLEQGLGQGVLKTCLRLARKKWGDLPQAMVTKIEGLHYAQLEDLAEALLDMRSPGDVGLWLDRFDGEG